jgi:hypothetical protein
LAISGQLTDEQGHITLNLPQFAWYQARGIVRPKHSYVKRKTSGHLHEKFSGKDAQE